MRTLNILGIIAICVVVAFLCGVVAERRLFKRKRRTRSSAPLADQVYSLFGVFLRTYGIYMLLRPMLVNVNLIARYGTPERRAGFEELRNVLYWTFIMELVKICDDSDPRPLCIAKLIDALRDPVVLQELENKAAMTFMPKRLGEDSEMFRAMAAMEQAAGRKRFRVAYEKLVSDAARLANSPALKSYKSIRNKRIAHNELIQTADGKFTFFEIDGLKLKYGDEKVILELAREVMDGLSAVVRQSSFSWSSFFEPEERDVKGFWEIQELV